MHGPHAFDGIRLVVGHVVGCTPGPHPIWRLHAGMIGGLELDQRQVAEHPHMAWRRPRFVERPFDLDIVAGDTGSREAEDPTRKLSDVGRREERLRAEGDQIVQVEPRGELVNLLVDRRCIEIANQIARMRLAGAVADEMHIVEPRHFGATGRLDFAFIPRESPQRCPDAILRRVNRDELLDVRREIISLTQHAHRAWFREAPQSFVGTHFIVFEDAGNRILGIEPLVFEQHTASDHGSFKCCAPSAPERHSLLLHRRGCRLNGDRRVQDVVGSRQVGRHVHVRDIEGIRIVIKAVGRAIRR